MTIGHRCFGEGSQGVVVLHGWFSDHTVFEPMFSSLDTKTFTYAFMDYRGYGLSRETPGDHSIREIARDAIGLADHLGWARFHVVGHSMGGSAAQRVCVDAGARVKSCVCLTPVPASGVSMPDEQRALFVGAAGEDQNRRAIIDYSTGLRLPRAWLDAMVDASHRTTTHEAFAAYFHAWSETDFVAEAMGLGTPMLVAVGEHDLALTADIMRATFMQWYPQAILEIAPNAGHYPMQETPVYLAALIDRFMLQHAGA